MRGNLPPKSQLQHQVGILSSQVITVNSYLPAHSFPGLPQIISHRGYKGKFPENTLAAVQGAVQAGTHALEIDLHLSRDGVLVLSHVSTSPSKHTSTCISSTDSIPGPNATAMLWN
jgi:hypothetical protein